MVNVTYAYLWSFLNLTAADISAINTEGLLDVAIDLLNAYGADLPSMGGVAGAKTVALESKDRGFVLNLAALLYRRRYVDSQAVGLGGINVAGSGVSEQNIQDAAKEYGTQLSKRPSGKTG